VEERVSGSWDLGVSPRQNTAKEETRQARSNPSTTVEYVNSTQDAGVMEITGALVVTFLRVIDPGQRLVIREKDFDRKLELVPAEAAGDNRGEE
jgi:hypothetical protein